MDCRIDVGSLQFYKTTPALADLHDTLPLQLRCGRRAIVDRLTFSFLTWLPDRQLCWKMRRFLVTGLVTLQTAGSAHGLPHPSLRVDDANLSPTTWRQTTSATFKLISFPEDTQKPAVADHDLSVTDHDPSAPLEGDLGRELTELRTLRAQLAELAKDVSAREKWLAATAVSGTTVTDLSSPITDCDSLPCALRAILRKTKYSLSAVFTNYDDDESDESNEHNRTATVIPLPPWRRKLDQNATGDADGHVDGDSDSSSSANSSSSSSSSSSADGEGFDLRHPAHALFAVLLAMSLLLALLRSLASLAVSVCCGERCDGLLPLATEPCRSRGESRRRWGWAWERVWECWRKCPRTSEGRIRLGEEVEAGNGDWDEKRGFGDRDQCEKYWDEMRAECLGEYGTPYADADEQGPCYAAREYLVSEDQVLVLEGDNERRVEGRGDSQGRRDSLDSPPSSLCVSESSNLGDEIASFRLAVELVEGMFAASEEQRDREM